MKLSIIITCFNSQKTIAKCIESALNQNKKDYEVIVVNDGSNDESLKIINNYLKHDNFKVINEENKGLTLASGRGIKEAKGTYITFLDSDDTLKDDFVKTIYENLDDNDILAYSFDKVFLNGSEEKVNFPEGEYNGEEVKKLIEKLYFDNHSFLTFKYLPIYKWTKCVKREIALRIMDEYEKENFTLFEDWCYTFLILAKAKKVKVINYQAINYMQLVSSHSSKNQKGFEDYLALTNKMRDFIHRYSLTNKIDEDVFSTMEFDVGKFYFSRYVRSHSFFASKKFFNKLKKYPLYKRGKKEVKMSDESLKRKIYFYLLKYNQFSLIYFIFKNHQF